MKSLALLFLMLTLVPAAAARQSVSITARKQVYTRPKPSMDFKRRFTVNYPMVKAGSPVLSKKIEQTISYKRVFDFDLKDELGEIQWLEEADFKVKYNSRGLLCIWLFIAGSGAYPSSSTKTLVVDLSSGKPVTPVDVFVNQTALVAEVKKKQRVEIDRAIDELRKDPDRGESDPADLFKETIFSAEGLSEFEIDAKGITFIYDYNFPHVIQALQPDGRFTFSWREMKPYIKPNSPFAKFILR